MVDHIAFKCTWHDGGTDGFEGICSEDNMKFNVDHRVWCSRRENRCHKYLYEHGDYPGDYQGSPCYEGALFTSSNNGPSWEMGFGVYHTGQRAGQTIEPKGNLGLGSIGILTSRQRNVEESERIVVGIHYYRDRPYPKAGSYFIRGDDTLSFRVYPALRVRFWDHYSNPNTAKAKWGAGLYRWMSKDQVDSLLFELYSRANDSLRAKVRALLQCINSLEDNPGLQNSDNSGALSSATGEQVAQRLARIGQDAFSDNVRRNYGHQCCFPGCSIAEDSLLVGAHIARWSDAKDLRGETSNGLCLCLFHDRVFELGLFTLTMDFRVAANASRISNSPWGKRHVAPFEEQRIRLGAIKPAAKALKKHWKRIDFVPRARRDA